MEIALYEGFYEPGSPHADGEGLEWKVGLIE